MREEEEAGSRKGRRETLRGKEEKEEGVGQRIEKLTHMHQAM